MAKQALSLPFDGERLRRHRELSGLFQADLARRCSVDQSRISQLENGDGKPSPPLLRALARALNISTADLLRPDEGNAGPETGGE
ncbi:helix-turn-helix domain-containing protein [Microbispora sp. CA-102843]|uniref:helix-turn-helix domain-containing protein n=1 Tax=Microbispora sp. CA-102843 TaxID=3239952 RepID=UPI003D94947D